MKWLERLVARSPAPAGGAERGAAPRYVTPKVAGDSADLEEDFGDPRVAAAPPVPTATAATGNESMSARSSSEEATRVASAPRAEPEHATPRAARPALAPNPDLRVAMTPHATADREHPAEPRLGSSELEPRSVAESPHYGKKIAHSSSTSQERSRVEATSGEPSRAVITPNALAPARLPTPIYAHAEAPEPSSSAQTPLGTPRLAETSPPTPVAPLRPTPSELRPAQMRPVAPASTGPRLSIGRLVVEVTNAAAVQQKRAPQRRPAAPRSPHARGSRPSPLRFGLGVR